MTIDNVTGVGEAALTTIVLLVSAGVCTHICFGYGSRKWRESYIALICSLVVTVQVLCVYAFVFIKS
jgi:hypothetical protein